jgi:hypothetical protein
MPDGVSDGRPHYVLLAVRIDCLKSHFRIPCTDNEFSYRDRSSVREERAARAGQDLHPLLPKYRYCTFRAATRRTDRTVVDAFAG